MEGGIMPFIQGLTGIVIALFVGVFGFMIIWKIRTGDINLSRLISEANGDASMARFQLLIFTFVISLSLFWVIVKTGGFPPTIPSEILGLLGISAGSYVLGKGIQFSKTEGITGTIPA
jgi:hypothetical protein